MWENEKESKEEGEVKIIKENEWEEEVLKILKEWG